MRKLQKKLSLHKETIANLSAAHLRQAAAGTAQTLFCNPTQATCGCQGTNNCGLTEGMYCTLGGCTGAEN